MAGLLAGKSNGQISGKGNAEHGSRFARDPRWQIDSHNRQFKSLDLLNRESRRAGERFVQSGAIERIDHQRTGPRFVAGQGLRDQRAGLRGAIRVAAGTRRAVRPDRHGHPGFGEQPRHDIAVAAIVARPAKHINAGDIREAPQHFGRDRPARVQHQRIAVK
jgi:hypothetical protein